MTTSYEQGVQHASATISTRRGVHHGGLVCEIVAYDKSSEELLAPLLLAHVRDAVVSPNDGMDGLVVELVV
jgi:hypothetical protein